MIPKSLPLSYSISFLYACMIQALFKDANQLILNLQIKMYHVINFTET